VHLLATQSASLDETDIAVDLGQSAADMVVLSFSDSDLSALASAWKKGRDALPTLRLASLKQLRHPMSVDLYIDAVIAKAKVVIVRSLGGLDYWRYGLERLAEACRQSGANLITLPGDDRPDPRLAALSTVPSAHLVQFDAYFRHGGPDNMALALRFAAALARGEVPDALTPPIPHGATIIITASGELATASQRQDYLAAPGPSALAIFYRASILAGDFAPVTSLLQHLEAEGLSAVGVAITSLKDRDAERVLSELIAARRPSVIINATAFSARRQDDTTVLDAADCPVLQVALAGTSREAWNTSDRGLSPSDLAMNVVLPEIDGRLFTRAISFKAESARDDDLQYAGVLHAPAKDRVRFVAGLAAAWARLSSTPRCERRLAVMLSDYPARGGRTGYACGLDTAASAHEIVLALHEAGFTANDVDVAADDLIARLTEHPVDHITLSLEAYRDHLHTLPMPVRNEIASAWGRPEDDPACCNGAFSFPCLRTGNILLLLQPDRGARGHRKQGYHDTSCPPRHGYVALYAALRIIARIDALIHLGTHGTLEWLPGKALALSENCFPEATLGPLPVVYPFIVNNPGEAVQAKRRISAVAIGHLTPPLSAAGLHGGLAELEGLLEEYSEAESVDRRRVQLLEAEIMERAWRSGLAADCGVEKTDPPRLAVAKLDAQLCDIKDLAVRDSLHVFGRAPSPDAIDSLADATLRSLDAAPASREASNIRSVLTACATREREALISALDGRRVAPGPTGAPTRGRLDVLPTGRNLTTIDPRAIPTRTAATIGDRAAAEVIRRHLQDRGEYPRAVMLDLWASASLRTGGDDLAQALSYLGARPTWDHASSRVTGIEVLPLAKLDRPRIDVTLRISGLFRDIFQLQIAIFDMAVARIAALDEDDADNPLAAVRRSGGSLARIFGGEANVYGAGAADAALDTDWATRGDLARAYLGTATQAFGASDRSCEAAAQFAERVAAVDALVHPQDDRERDILDGDGVADFVGGFAAAAQMAGRTPRLYHIDTSHPEAPVARTIPEEIARIVRGRLTNPRWIAGILKHGHRGVGEVAQAVDALYAFAATGAGVPSHLFDVVHDALIADAETLHRLASANPAGTEAICDRLEDAIRRGLWTPRRNAVHGELSLMRLAASDQRERA